MSDLIDLIDVYIYQLLIGIMLFEFIAGVAPFTGDEPENIFANILEHSILLTFSSVAPAPKKEKEKKLERTE